MNIQKMMQQAQKLKLELAESQKLIHASEHEGSAAGGLLRIRMKGDLSVLSAHVDPSLLQEDVSLLEDMLVVAVSDVLNKIAVFSDKHSPKMPGGFGF